MPRPRNVEGVLPRATDLVDDALEMGCDLRPDEDLIWFVLDVVCALFPEGAKMTLALNAKRAEWKGEVQAKKLRNFYMQ